MCTPHKFLQQTTNNHIMEQSQNTARRKALINLLKLQSHPINILKKIPQVHSKNKSFS